MGDVADYIEQEIMSALKYGADFYDELATDQMTHALRKELARAHTAEEQQEEAQNRKRFQNFDKVLRNARRNNNT